MRKFAFFLSLLSQVFVVSAQLQEDFSDGDFTNSPVWSGDVAAFQVSSEQLNSNNDPDAGGLNEYYLSTSSNIAYDDWEFFVDLQFSTSGANFVDVYLISDQTDLLSSTLNGYFIRLGDTADEIVLYKVENGTNSVLIDFDIRLFDSSSSNPFRIRVSRTPSNLWTLEYDDGDTGSFEVGGTATDGTFTTSVAFGFYIEQSSLNSAVNGHFFDDIEIASAPTITSATATSATTVQVDFSESVEEVSAEDTDNYTIAGIDITDAVRDVTDNSIVTLTVSDLTNGTSYDLEVSDVEDLSENAIATNSTVAFQYLVFGTPGERDIVINEFNVDQSGSVGLPEAEFVELYNPTDQYFDLAGFVIEEEASSTSTSGAMGSFTLAPRTYVIICDEDDVSSFTSFGDVIGVSSYPDFNLSNASIILKNGSSDVVDRVDYEEVPENGITYEQINPTLPCTGTFNFASSTDASGGTPGSENSVFDDTADNKAPSFESLTVINSDSLHVSFDEPLEESALTIDDFEIEGFTVSAVALVDDQTVGILLTSALSSETFYTLSYSDIQDCSGNEMIDAEETFYYDVTAPSLERVIVATSNALFLVFNEPLNESEAEEEDNFSIDGLGTPETNTLQDSASNRILVEFEDNFDLSTTYTLNYSALEDTLENATGALAITFTYDEEIDTVLAITSNILEVSFKENVESTTATNVFNYFEEDVGNPSSVSQIDAQTIRLIFSANFDDNSDLLLFVEGISSEDDSEVLITPAFTFRYDTDNPDIESVEVISENQLNLIFDETLEESSATNLSFYQLEGESFPVSATLNINQVTLTFENAFAIETELVLTYTRISDLYGNFSSSNRTVSFTYDPLAPRLDSVFLKNDREVTLFANEAIALNSISNASFRVDDITPVEISIFGPDSLRLDLVFTEDIEEDRNQTLEISAWEDLAGNELETSITESFNSRNPRLVSISALNDSTLSLLYNKAMNASAFDRENYEFDVLEINELMAVSDQELQIVTASFLEENTNYSLQLFGIQDENGRDLQFDSLSFLFETFLEEVRLVDSRTVELVFETVFDTFSTSQFLANGKEPDALSLDPDDKSIVRLLLEEAVEDNDTLVVYWSGVSDLYGRDLPDHTELVVNDKTPPQMTGIFSDFNGAIEVTFSESIDEEALMSESQFTIPSIGNPDELEFLNSNTVSLLLPGLVVGTTYQLVAENFPDLNGNYQASDTLAFVYDPPEVIEDGQVLITEIMADPSPSVLLPEAEYIELFNNTNDTLNLRSLILGKPNDEVQLPDLEVLPGSYIALVDANDVELFELIENVTGLDGIISFSNDGDSIFLQNIDGDPVDLVEYEQSWYGDTEKDDGGFSLELINLGSDCDGAANWRASEDSSGGTPGSENSVFSTEFETVPPSALGISLVDSVSIMILFSEELDPLSVVDSIFSIEELTIVSIGLNTGKDEITVQFDTIPVDRAFELSIDGLLDCSGNSIESTTLLFGFGETPVFGDLVISEIMSDPDPAIGLPVSEYIEIYNRSDKLLSLQNLVFEDATSVSGVIDGILRPGEYRLLVPSGEFSEFGSLDVSISGVASWPSLNNDGEEIKLKIEDETIFRVAFELGWHEPENQDGGVALEMKDVNNPCGQSENWGSSVAPEGGTPGQSNSISEIIPDNFGPNLVRGIALNKDSIQLIFDEILSPGQFIFPDIDGGLTIVDSTVLIQGEEVFFAVSPSLTQGQEYVITIENLTDCLGNNIGENRTTVVLPFEAEFNELLLSEVLFNPRSGGSDFIELYNTSDVFLTLKGIQLRNATATSIISEDMIIGPGEYLALTEDRASLLLFYPSSNEEYVYEIAELPTLANEEGVITIYTEQGLLDSLYYEDGFHNPLLEDLDGVSLERISITAGNTSDNWTSASSNVGFATPGFVNSQNLDSPSFSDPVEAEPKVFVPGSGFNSFTTINYEFDEAGFFANIYLYDQNGRLIRTLAEGISLSTEGFVRWDGTNDSGAIARVGYYVVIFEVFGGGGATQIFKETVVVGRDF